MKRTALADLPLFADDEAIGQALLGTRRAAEWRQLVPLFEGREGFPKVDEVMGGRYVPAVAAFFEVEYGLRKESPSRPDGIERPDAFSRPRRAVSR